MAHSDEFTAEKPRAALAIFCRAPRLGQVKTRIAQTRGHAFALGLYRAMLADSFALGRALAPEVETFAVFTPDDAFEGDGSLEDFWNGPRLAQPSGDLGARMLDALAQLRACGYERVCLIGSDAPDLPLSLLQRAFEVLGERELVVGESADGGFYLLGAAREVAPRLFDGITWSRSDVFKRLTLNIEADGERAAFLPAWRDVDDEADLLELQRRLFQLGMHAPRTREYLAQRRQGAEDSREKL